MPTRPHSTFYINNAWKRTIPVLCCLIILCLLTACSSPRIQGRAEYEQHANACDAALDTAIEQTEQMNNTDDLLYAQYHAADSAQHNWLDVAVQCPQRFTEGTLRSAQAQYLAMQLANRLGVTAQPLTVNHLDQINALNIGKTALAQAALAEDRAGFSTEVLAGRVAAGKAESTIDLLAVSNNHKQTASRMMYFAPDTQDLRRKVYSTDQLIASPNTMVDPNTGLLTNTVAMIEMNCAIEELTAIQNTGELSTELETDSAKAQLRAQLLQLSMLIATHAYTAFTLGYPAADYALFEQQS